MNQFYSPMWSARKKGSWKVFDSLTIALTVQNNLVATMNNTTICPHCKKEIDIQASVCPHCTKNVAAHTLQQRNPDAFAVGSICSLIAMVVGCFIHWDYLRKKSLMTATTRWICGSVNSGKIGRLRHSRAAFSATGKSPGLWPRLA